MKILKNFNDLVSGLLYCILKDIFFLYRILKIFVCDISIIRGCSGIFGVGF